MFTLIIILSVFGFCLVGVKFVECLAGLLSTVVIGFVSILIILIKMAGVF